MVAENNHLPSWGNELLRLLSIVCPSLRAEAIRTSPIEKKLIDLKLSK
jgi:hypothetical protein